MDDKDTLSQRRLRIQRADGRTRSAPAKGNDPGGPVVCLGCDYSGPTAADVERHCIAEHGPGAA